MNDLWPIGDGAVINTDVESGWDYQCECWCSGSAALVRISTNIKAGCLLLFHSPAFFPVPPHSLSLSPRLQLHCYKQESHCALVLSAETRRERGERGMQGKTTASREKDGMEWRRGGTQRKGPCVCVQVRLLRCNKSRNMFDTTNTGNRCMVKLCETK